MFGHIFHVLIISKFFLLNDYICCFSDFLLFLECFCMSAMQFHSQLLSLNEASFLLALLFEKFLW